MAEITLKGLGHSYKANPKSEADYALKPVDLVWEQGKTYALLGPSGCGKTTMLNIISGLLKPSDGQLLFDGKDVTAATTSERNIAQVFQFPVIYTTKSVRGNLAFPLECRNWPKEQIKDRVEYIAALLDLTEILDYPARKLSADQKQLISLGRGLVRNDVSAVLLDEPLTVIDPQMKFTLRRKLREINRATGITMILVTHDQSEAMSFADEVVVMKDGCVQQSGSPEQLFARPNNEFVGYFIGSPPLNLFSVQFRNECLYVPVLDQLLPADAGGSLETIKVGVRPEHLKVQKSSEEDPQAQVTGIDDLGIEQVFSMRGRNGELFKVKSRLNRDLLCGDSVEVTAAEKDVMIFKEGLLVR